MRRWLAISALASLALMPGCRAYLDSFKTQPKPKPPYERPPEISGYTFNKDVPDWKLVCVERKYSEGPPACLTLGRLRSIVYGTGILADNP